MDSDYTYDFRFMVGHRMFCGTDTKLCYDYLLSNDLKKFKYAEKHIECMRDCLGPLQDISDTLGLNSFIFNSTIIFGLLATLLLWFY